MIFAPIGSLCSSCGSGMVLCWYIGIAASTEKTSCYCIFVVSPVAACRSRSSCHVKRGTRGTETMLLKASTIGILFSSHLIAMAAYSLDARQIKQYHSALMFYKDGRILQVGDVMPEQG